MDAAPKLSILAPVPVRPDGESGEATRETLRLAALADRLGYHRYWLAGRIDLGISRIPSPGGASAAADAARTPEFPHRVATLMAHPGSDPALDDAQPAPPATPSVSASPDVWLLGADLEAARLAALLGASFSFAHFIAPDDGAEVIRAYTRMFTPSAQQSRPRASLSVSVVCHERASVARRLFDRDAVYYARLALGERPRYPALEEVARERFTDDELTLVEDELRRTVVGTPVRIREKLLELAADHHVDELVLRSISPDPQVRERTFTLIAQAFELAGAAGRAA